jgi:hypothetical protein
MEPNTRNGEAPDAPRYSAADIGALAHLYRGEMYRSKVWRMRLDTTTNWAVVTTGIVFSVVYAQPVRGPSLSVPQCLAGSGPGGGDQIHDAVAARPGASRWRMAGTRPWPRIARASASI